MNCTLYRGLLVSLFSSLNQSVRGKVSAGRRCPLQRMSTMERVHCIKTNCVNVVVFSSYPDKQRNCFGTNSTWQVLFIFLNKEKATKEH